MRGASDRFPDLFGEPVVDMSRGPVDGPMDGATPGGITWSKPLGTFDDAEVLKDLDLTLLRFDYLVESGACVVGDPERGLEIATRYKAADCDLLLCLLNPYKIPHLSVMRSIELLGEHVIPKLRRPDIQSVEMTGNPPAPAPAGTVNHR